MKAIKFLSGFVLMALIASLIFSCSKGDTGATGAQGTAGPAGPTGATGATGASDSNNISVIYDSIAPGSWTGGSGRYVFSFDVPALDRPNSDVVIITVSLTHNFYYALPVSNLFVNGDEMGYNYSSYVVYISYSGTSAPTLISYYKITVIRP